MPISTNCPSCKAIFRLADELAGKRVKCRKCDSLFVVPRTDEATIAPGMRVPGEDDDVDEPAPKPKSAVKLKAPPPPPRDLDKDEDEEQDGDEKGRQRDRDREDDDEDEPRRKRSSREEPRRRKRAKSGSTSMTMILALGGLALFMCVLCGGGAVGFFVYQRNEAAPQGPLTVNFGADGMFRTNNRLTAFDKTNRDGKRHKSFAVQMDLNRNYEIDLISDDFDAFLYLVDPNGKVVAVDDDGGDDLDSRIVFRPLQPGPYRIEATSLNGRETGNFSLNVKRN